MPVRRKYTRKPRRRVRRRAPLKRGSKVALPRRVTGNFASATETFSVAVTAGVVNDFTFSLHDLVRTNALMEAYQYYRVSSVELRFKPYYDTFPGAPGGGTALPYLFFQYDKSGTLFGLNANGFEDMGTKAIRFDDKTISRKWKPSVLTDVGAGNVTQFKVCPWLPTYVAGLKNDQIDHYGAIFYISKMAPSDGNVYDVDVVVNVQYRKPAITPGQQVNVNPPRIKQGNTTQIDLSLNPVLQG